MQNISNTHQQNILITGATGFIGQYMIQEFNGCNISTLQRDSNAGIVCDLTQSVPAITEHYDVVVHCAGTIKETTSMSVNFDGTRRLLEGLANNPPGALVLISTVDVYGKEECEEIDENTPLRPVTKFAHSKVLAENAARDWCLEHNVDLIIMRIATPFGNGIHGPAEQLYTRVSQGRYFHIRGNESRRSVVCAFDVARVARQLIPHPGTYNVADGRNRTLYELTDAMAANGGDSKRVLVLPDKWAKKLAALGSVMPLLHLPFDKKKLAHELAGRTYSTTRLRDTIGIGLFDTVEVIARREPDYPYAIKY